jgi:hypothetical protein
MRLVTNDAGVLRVRWTWLPLWLSLNGSLKHVVGRQLRDVALLNGVTTDEEDLEAMHHWFVTRVCALYPAFSGLETYLNALLDVQVDGSQQAAS